MPSKAKTKGSQFERELAKYLSDLYGESFVRIPNSGAYIGGLNTHRKTNLSENQIKSFKGDIVPPDSWVNFNAEAKNYNDFPFHQVVTGKCKQLETWLDQLLAVFLQRSMVIGLLLSLIIFGQRTIIWLNYIQHLKIQTPSQTHLQVLQTPSQIQNPQLL
jgi:hypothetical protein